MSEYYVKFSTESEAQGPFTVEELRAFVQIGQLTPRSMHFFDDVEGWQPIETNSRLQEELWPTKRKLELKKVDTLKDSRGKTSAPTVKEMLVASENKMQKHALPSESLRGSFGLSWLAFPALGFLHLILGVVLLLPQWSLIQTAFGAGAWMTLLASPSAAMGGWLLFLGVAFLFSTQSAYAWGRYTALVLMGYLSIHAWTLLYSGSSEIGLSMLAGAVGFGLGVYALTITTSLAFFWLSIAAAFGGVLATGWAFFQLSA